MAGLKKAGSNWVDGDRFFDRDGEDSVVEIGVEARHVRGAWDRIKAGFGNVLRGVEERVDSLAIGEVRVKLRAGIDPGNWRQKGDAVCAALAKNERPVVLALDELDLKPWNEKTALDCLAALAETCGLDLPLAARKEMCRRLRCLVPHHVQRFFDSLEESLRLDGRRHASLEDVERVYTGEMLSIRGQADLDHYESRLRLVLGPDGYRAALALLTEAAVNDGVLQRVAMELYREQFRVWAVTDHPVPIDDVLRVLEHDGYLEPWGDGEYRFVSGLLEDWWRARHGRHFVPVARRVGSQGV